MGEVVTTAQEYWRIVTRLRKFPDTPLIRKVAVNDMRNLLAKTPDGLLRNRIIVWLAHNQKQSPSNA